MHVNIPTPDVSCEDILYVEDDPVVRRLTSRILREHGYRVLQASTVEEARKLYAENAVDILLSDVRLPDGNGAQLAAQLRDEGSKIPVLLVSGFADDEALRTISERGFELLYKPYSAELLASTLRDVLEQAG